LVQEAAGRSLRATILRPFNHTGPGQSASFVVPSFCRQIALIEKGLQAPVIKVGELDDERDFMDVADVLDLYIRVLDRGHELPNGTLLNAASGIPRKIGDILTTLLSLAPAKVAVERDPARLRAVRANRILGNADAAKAALGWSPVVPFEDTLKSTLAYWRTAVLQE
jgi:GDP-4-dehydro-6-deoxy-D-mannose reductase